MNAPTGQAHPMCLVENDEQCFVCTSPAGHTDDHVALGAGLDDAGNYQVCEVWEQ